MEELKQEEEIIEEGKMTFKNKLVWIALFGILLGFVIKTEAAKRFTIGFEDYKIPDAQKTYDISQMEKDLLKKRALLEKQKADVEKAATISDQKKVDSAQNASCDAGTGETCKP
jgi:hypothetical protein